MYSLLFVLCISHSISQEREPKIGFVPFGTRIDQIGKPLPNADLGSPIKAYQGEFAYSVQLDRFGRPCPSGNFTLAKTLAEQLNSIGLRREGYLLTLPHDHTGYFLFASGRLLYMKHASGEGRYSIYSPDETKGIISIDEHINNNDVDPRKLRNYAQFKSIKPLSEYRIINQLPGNFYSYVPPNKNPRDTTIADYPKQPTPFVEAPPTADDLKHTFVPDYSTRYAIRFRNLIYTVTIDKETGHYLFEDFARKMDASTASRTELPPWLLKPRKPDESVYEHKQVMLIPGFLHDIGTEEWVFVPDLGGKCIPMEPYLKTYHPHSRRIYNLPGKFEVKK